MAQTEFPWDKIRHQLFSAVGIFLFFLFWIGALFFLLFNILLLTWDRLWRWLGVWNLVTIRFIMRRRNLYDTSELSPPNPPKDDPRCPVWNPSYQHARAPDGTFNDLDYPRMGSAGARFGRNFPLRRLSDRSSLENDINDQDSSFWNPSPRLVSQKLLTRTRFRPATTLNMLAAAWIQFQVHDWVNHTRSCTQRFPEVKRKDEPTDKNIPGINTIRRTEQDRPLPRNPGPIDRPDPPTFSNTETHWWDGSQLYGKQPCPATSIARNGW